ncbi:flagellar basal-body rod modification protein FlgD [Gammaproteobacteria bacterium]
MSTMNTNSAAASNPLTTIKGGSAAASTGSSAFSALSSSKTLGQTDFLKLLTTQLKNQDPSKPMDSTQFVSQLAQFSALAGVTDLNTTMKGVSSSLQSSQLVQGTSLVGHQVLATGSRGELTDTLPLTGAVNLPASTNSLTVEVQDAAGHTVQTLSLGNNSAGTIPFSWDGTLANGQHAPSGTYQVKASYLQDGKQVTADTLVAARVNSVALGSSGLVLELEDLGEVGLDQVSMLM